MYVYNINTHYQEVLPTRPFWEENQQIGSSLFVARHHECPYKKTSPRCPSVKLLISGLVSTLGKSNMATELVFLFMVDTKVKVDLFVVCMLRFQEREAPSIRWLDMVGFKISQMRDDVASTLRSIFENCG